jgi:regulatory protein SWI5
MLSNPINLQQRQRQHRRQQSTPTAFDATKVSNLPNIQRHGSHRRGMSLDTRQHRLSQQDTNTNQGFNDNQQQLLREAQQQRLARQGQYVPQYTPTRDEGYSLSPFVTDPGQDFDSVLAKYGISSQPASPYDNYSGHVNTNVQANQNDFSQGLMDNGYYSQSGNNTPSDLIDFSMAYDDPSSQQDWGATIRPNGKNIGRRVSGGIAQRVARFEGIASAQQVSRPITPPNHNVSSKCTFLLYSDSFTLIRTRLLSTHARPNASQPSQD